MTPREDLAAAYKRRHSTALTPLAKGLQDHIEGIVKDQPKIDRVVARAKSPKSFLDKATRLDEGKLRYPDPLNQIQDQIAARIVTFYLSDVPPPCAACPRLLRASRRARHGSRVT
jgi:ppGpp synthetase/RelA/SpoT-type nucleotidyltranferase